MLFPFFRLLRLLGREEISWVITEASKYLSPDLQVHRRDVLSAWSGVRPLAEDPHANHDGDGDANT